LSELSAVYVMAKAVFGVLIWAIAAEKSRPEEEEGSIL